MNNKMEFYVLQRDDEEMIVSVSFGGDPLYGNGSWSLKSGPFLTWQEANQEILG